MCRAQAILSIFRSSQKEAPEKIWICGAERSVRRSFLSFKSLQRIPCNFSHLRISFSNQTSVEFSKTNFWTFAIWLYVDSQFRLQSNIISFPFLEMAKVPPRRREINWIFIPSDAFLCDFNPRPRSLWWTFLENIFRSKKFITINEKLHTLSERLDRQCKHDEESWWWGGCLRGAAHWIFLWWTVGRLMYFCNLKNLNFSNGQNRGSQTFRLLRLFKPILALCKAFSIFQTFFCQAISDLKI